VKLKYIDESESAWRMAGKNFKHALAGWARIKEPNHPDIMSTGCSLARSLSELGRKREALRLLSSIVDSGKKGLKLDENHHDENAMTTCGISPTPSSDMHVGGDLPDQRRDTTNKIETLAVCIWSMAVYTIEERPNEDGRVRSMEHLKTGIDILKKAGVKKSKKSAELLTLFQDEFHRMFVGKRFDSAGNSIDASMNDRNPPFVTV
jgi:hypothetical protein